jgi:hypothetical protein
VNELPPPGIWADSEAWLGEEAHGVSAEFAVAELRASGLVDIEWYRAAYDDPPALDAVSHYLMHGAAEGRLPNRYFDTDWYLQQNPQVRRAGINPLLHYIRPRPGSTSPGTPASTRPRRGRRCCATSSTAA